MNLFEEDNVSVYKGKKAQTFMFEANTRNEKIVNYGSECERYLHSGT